MAKSKKKKGGAPKKKGGSPKSVPITPKKSNEYIRRRDARVNAYREAEQDTTIQFMTDTLMLTLNDPEIMGKDVFGAKRLAIVIEGWGKKWDLFHGALELGDEREYFQEKLDQVLRKIVGDKLVPFNERYEWLSE